MLMMKLDRRHPLDRVPTPELAEVALRLQRAMTAAPKEAWGLRHAIEQKAHLVLQTLRFRKREEGVTAW